MQFKGALGELLRCCMHAGYLGYILKGWGACNSLHGIICSGTGLHCRLVFAHWVWPAHAVGSRNHPNICRCRLLGGGVFLGSNRDWLGKSCEEMGIRYRPVEVLLNQCLAMVLVIVCNPLLTILVPVGPYYGGLVGKSSPALSGDLVHRIAAIREYCLTHCDMICDASAATCPVLACGN